MNLAFTLVIQGVVFFLVAWAVMKFFWPTIMGAIEERQKKIAAGLSAASKSEKDLEEAEARSKEIIREARDRAAEVTRNGAVTGSPNEGRLERTFVELIDSESELSAWRRSTGTGPPESSGIRGFICIYVHGAAVLCKDQACGCSPTARTSTQFRS